jgi:PAS domain-containing protein
VAPRPAPAELVAGPPTTEAVLHRALAAVPSGVCVVDVLAPDQPLVYVNPAFERLAGLPREQLLGRNCRVLQGTDSDPAPSPPSAGLSPPARSAGSPCSTTAGRSGRRGGTSCT